MRMNVERRRGKLKKGWFIRTALAWGGLVGDVKNRDESGCLGQG